MARRTPARLAASALLALAVVVPASAQPATAGAAATAAPELISRTPDGRAPNDASELGPISGDGRYVTYSSFATDILPGTPTDPNGPVWVAYLVDRTTGTTRRLAQDPDGTAWPGTSTATAVSPQGRFVWFTYWGGKRQPSSSTLQPSRAHTYRYEVRTGTSVKVSNLDVQPSRDGRAGVVATTASLGPRDANDLGIDDYRLHLPFGRPHLLSRGVDGLATGSGAFPDGIGISGDGGRVVFEDLSQLLPGVPVDGPARFGQVYLWDHGTTRLVSGTASGAAGDGSSGQPAISADGSTAVFTSLAPSLGYVPHQGTIFRRDLDDGPLQRLPLATGWYAEGERHVSLSADGGVVTVVDAPYLVGDPVRIGQWHADTGTTTTVATLPVGALDVGGTATSDDGETIAYTTIDDGSWGVYALDVD